MFDPFEPACRLAHAAKAWVHVDGAFGLWAAVSERHRHLLAGAELADSWATDGHKWLNLPFDSGLVFVADAAAHRASFAQDTSYSVPTEQVRNQKDWNPEWSRRGRGFPFYAAVRALGRAGIGEMVDRCCRHAERLVREIGALDGAEILAAPVINQGLVRFLGPDGNHDRFTDTVIRRIQADGVAWFGGVTWCGQRAMRISVCNWLTSDDDIDRTVASIRKVLSRAGQRGTPVPSHDAKASGEARSSLTPRPFRRALLQEGCHAFAEVGAAVGVADQVVDILVGDLRLQAAHRLLGGLTS